jgi:hypothetical protein
VTVRKGFRPKPKKVRLRVGPKLNREEVRRLQDRAKADLPSIASYVAGLLEQDRKRRGSRKVRQVRGAGPGDRRAPYEVGLTLTAEERERLEARAAEQGRSLSGYVAMLIVEELRGR